MSKKVEILENQLTAILNETLSEKISVDNLIHYSDITSSQLLNLEKFLTQAIESLSQAIKACKQINKEEKYVNNHN